MVTNNYCFNSASRERKQQTLLELKNEEIKR